MAFSTLFNSLRTAPRACFRERTSFCRMAWRAHRASAHELAFCV